MPRSIQSNVHDVHVNVDISAGSTLRSVTVFAIGPAETVNTPQTMERIRARAASLIRGRIETDESRTFSEKDMPQPGEPFGVEIHEYESHLVRAADGPLRGETVVAFRAVGWHRWI